MTQLTRDEMEYLRMACDSHVKRIAEMTRVNADYKAQYIGVYQGIEKKLKVMIREVLATGERRTF